MRIAVWNTAYLGDALLTLPLMNALHSAWPRAQLDMYVRRGFGSLFAAQKILTSVFEVGKENRTPLGMLRLMRQVNARSYNIWIGAHLSPRSSLVALASNAPVRVGYSGAWHREASYTTTVARRFGELPEIERLLQLMSPLDEPDIDTETALHPAEWQNLDDHNGWPPAWPDVWPSIDLPVKSREAAEALWRSLPSGPVLGVHPGSTWGTKRWTRQGFAFVIRQAVEHGANVMMLAGKEDIELVDEVLNQAGLADHPRVCNLSGSLSLVELAAHLARLDAYLTNDSGPMHLAWLQHTPVVAMFGPTVEEFGFFPRGAGSIVVEAPSGACGPCRPCGLHGPQLCPRGDHACMTAISEDEVWKAVKGLLFATTGA